MIVDLGRGSGFGDVRGVEAEEVYPRATILGGTAACAACVLQTRTLKERTIRIACGLNATSNSIFKFPVDVHRKIYSIA